MHGHDDHNNDHNEESLKSIIRQASEEIAEALKSNPFFTATMSVTVQRGVICASRIGVEKTRQFLPRK